MKLFDELASALVPMIKDILNIREAIKDEIHC